MRNKAVLAGYWIKCWNQKFGPQIPSTNKTLFWRLAFAAEKLFECCRSMDTTKKVMVWFVRDIAQDNEKDRTIWPVLRQIPAFRDYQASHHSDPLTSVGPSQCKSSVIKEESGHTTPKYISRKGVMDCEGNSIAPLGARRNAG